MQSNSQFKQPTAQKREKALGDFKSLSKNNKEQLTKIINYFKPVPNPSPDDWLYNQKESGQTFDEYCLKPRLVDTKRKKIYVQPLEPSIDQTFIEKLLIFSNAFFYGIKVEFLPCLDINKLGIKSRDNNKQKQYFAPQILSMLQNSKPKDAYCIIGICLTDIYNKESWNYVFGLASLSDKVGVFSFARYQESFYYPGAKVDMENVIYRSCKVMCHEIVHQFGIKHCIYYHCIMNGSNHYEEAGNKPFQLCPVCLRKLQHALQFNISDRYQALINATKEINIKMFQIDKFIYSNLIFNKIDDKQENNNNIIQSSLSNNKQFNNAKNNNDNNIMQ